MISAGPPRNPYDVPIVRHRWVFVAGLAFSVLLVVLEIFLIIHNLQNHRGFDVSFWVGTATLVVVAMILIRAGRLRRSTAAVRQYRS